MGETMRKKDDKTGGCDEGQLITNEADPYLVGKVTDAARVRLAQARAALAAATEALASGDLVTARALLEEARSLADLRADIPDYLQPELAEELSVLLGSADAILSARDALVSMLSPDYLLKLNKKLLKENFVFQKGGSFQGSKAQKDTYNTPYAINWYFWVDKKLTCKKLCMVSVFCFYKKNDKGEYTKLVTPAVDGFKKEYIKDNTGFTRDVGDGDKKDGQKKKKPFNTLPHGGKDLGGFAVDTPFYHPRKSGNPAIKCPCYHAQKAIDDKGNAKKGGRHVGSFDTPAAKTMDVHEYFETAVLCLDKKPYVVLNSMKWRLAENGVEILNKHGKPLEKGQSMDLGDASPAFKLTLLDWIARAKKEHGIDEIECEDAAKKD
ncbi:hypothetical protein CHH27_26040 [Labrenzia sp. VG12]|nr:hypothetical protein CHH27_26040 [Labrenzia sp. VG12]